MRRPDTGTPARTARTVLWLAASLGLHLALLHLHTGPELPAPEEPVSRRIEVDLLSSPPRSAASPTAVPTGKEPQRPSPSPAHRPERNIAASARPAPIKASEIAPTPPSRPKTARPLMSAPCPTGESPDLPSPNPPAPDLEVVLQQRPADPHDSPDTDMPPPPEAGVRATVEGKAMPLQIPPPPSGSLPGQGRSSHNAPLVEATPRYESNSPPHYPRIARLRGWEGEVLLRVIVDIDGRSREIKVHRSSGFPLLDDSAVQAVRRWRFQPARRGDRPVIDEVIVPLRFELRK